MEIQWQYHEERTTKSLQECINILGPRGAAKTGKNKDNMEKNGGERKEKKRDGKNWGKVQMAVANRDGWRDCVEALCATSLMTRRR